MGNYKTYDVCIIGAGLIGSSAARHASETPNVQICLVGPDEPQVRTNQAIFGAWFDEGRITRETDNNFVWSCLASRSIKRYIDLEKTTGIQFYNPVGYLALADKGSALLRDTYNSVASQGGQAEILSASEIQSQFPYLRVSHTDVGLHEKKIAGYINPRRLREAQLAAASNQGCDFIKDIAIQVKEQTISNTSSTLMEVMTQGGTVVYARKVLLAVGAFSEFHDLFPAGVKPDIFFAGHTVIFAEIGEKDSECLKNMPSIYYAGTGLAAASKVPENRYNSYILPPIKYPNGKTYLKLGHGPQYETMLTTRRDITNWYKEAPPQHIVEGLKEILLKVFPGLSPLSYHTDTCVIAPTPNTQPYIDMMTATLGVALGGNGWAAKSCDEIGKIAADMILSNEWNYDIPKEKFKVLLKPNISKL